MEKKTLNTRELEKMWENNLKIEKNEIYEIYMKNNNYNIKSENTFKIEKVFEEHIGYCKVCGDKSVFIDGKCQYCGKEMI